MRPTFYDFNFVSIETGAALAFSHAAAWCEEVDVGEDFANKFPNELWSFVDELQLVVRGTLDVDSRTGH